MKKLVLIGSALCFMPLGAVQEKGYTERLKKEKDRFIEEVKTAGVELYKRVMPEKKSQKKEERGERLTYMTSRQQRPVIVESCEHCRDLCGERAQASDLV